MRFYLMFNPYTWPHRDQPVRMSGQSTELYQASLEATVAHAKAADKYGFDGIFCSEQHGNVEGIPEVTGNPILTSMFLASETERIKVGQLSNAITVHNPLYIADQIAQLDQFTKGRVLAGFARGNTPRWADQYGQHISMGATLSDKSAHDERNFRCLKECWEIVKLAWTQESFTYDGEFWKFPVEGTEWHYPHTPTYGTGVDEGGTVTAVSIAPQCYQDPYPPIFAPMSGRAQTVRFWAREGASVVCLSNREDLVKGMLGFFEEEAEAAGRPYKRGEGMVLGGNFVVHHDEAIVREREQIMRDWDQYVYGVAPYNMQNPWQITGTPEQIIEEIGIEHEKFGTEEFILLADYPAPYGSEISLEMLELFGSEVLPAFGVKTEEATLA